MNKKSNDFKIVASILAIIGCGLLYSAGSYWYSIPTTMQDLLGYIHNGDTDRVVEFIREADGKDWEIEKYALQLALKHDIPGGREAAEEMFKNSPKYGARPFILRMYDLYDLVFPDYRILCEYFLSSNIESEAQLGVEARLIATYPQPEPIRYMLDLFAKELEIHSDYPLPGPMLRVAAKTRKLLEIQASQDEQINKKLSLMHQKAKALLHTRKIIEKKREIESLEKEMGDEKIYKLAFFVIGQYGAKLGYSVWEIQTYESENRSVLLTKEAFFQRRGYAEMYVRPSSAYPVKIKEELGGFTQVWDVYVEVTDEERQTHRENNAKLSSLRRELRELEQELDAKTGELELKQH